MNAKLDFEIIIRDENETIPRAECEAIFDRFFRRGTELRRTTTGTGLGLSIVRHVAEAHGGNVCVRRRDDGEAGNEFVIRLPFVPPGIKEKRTENL